MDLNDEIVARYNEEGLYCKEDIIFELLIHILKNTDSGWSDLEALEEAYRDAYEKLPFHIELK